MSLARAFSQKNIMTTSLSGFLIASSLLPFDAKAENPKANSAGEQQKPTILRQASDYAETHKAIGIIVSKGKENENGLTGAQIGEMIQGYFSSLGITSKVFTAPSSADYTAVGYTVKTRLYGPVGLDKAKGMAVIAASEYDDAYGTHLRKNPANPPSNDLK